MPVESNNRDCPLCCARATGPQASLQYAMFDGSPLPNTLTITVCQNCGMLYNCAAPSAQQLEQYYNSSNHYCFAKSAGTGSCLPLDQSRYQQIEQILRRYCTTDCRVVDVGCGQGGLVERLRTGGYARAYGVDPLFGKNAGEFRADSDPIIKGDATRLTDAVPAADFLLYSHVFEHLLNPSQALEQAKRILPLHGKIYIEVPDASMYGQGVYDPLTEVYYEHLNHFDIQTLCLLLKANGFQVIESGEKQINAAGGTVGCIYAVASIDNRCQTSIGLMTIKPIPQYLCSSHMFSQNMRIVNSVSSETQYLWGVSQYLQLLLAMGPLKKCNIQGLFDRDEYKQKQTINGTPVQAVNQLYQLEKNSVVFVDARYYSSMQNYLAKEGIALHLFPLGFAQAQQ